MSGLDDNSFTTKAVTATYTATANDYYIFGTGTFTVTLPTAAAAGAGRVYVVVQSGAGAVTVASAANISGQASIVLDAAYDSVTVVSDGTVWYAVASTLDFTTVS